MQIQHDTAAVRNTKELGSTVKTTALAIPRPNEITILTELNLTLVEFLFFRQNKCSENHPSSKILNDYSSLNSAAKTEVLITSASST